MTEGTVYRWCSSCKRRRDDCTPIVEYGIWLCGECRPAFRYLESTVLDPVADPALKRLGEAPPGV